MQDNLSLIKPLLRFETEDDFYYLQILQCKKENPQLGSNSRVIKNYYINSIDYLEERYEEIKSLCTLNNARAMLRLNKRSYKKVAFRTMVNVANTMANGEYQFIRKYYDRACGETHNEKANKTWIIDFDNHLQEHEMDQITEFISGLRPYGLKTIEWIPSKAGWHLISSPFDVQEFGSFPFLMELPAIQKDNPTNLFIP